MSELIKSAGNARINITHLINQIIRCKVIPAYWEFTTIDNCNKRNEDTLERKVMETEISRSYSKNDWVKERLIGQKVDINIVQFEFIQRRWTTDINFILRQLLGECLVKKEGDLLT